MRWLSPERYLTSIPPTNFRPKVACRHKRSTAALTSLEALLVALLAASAARGRLAPAMGALILLCGIWTFGLVWPGQSGTERGRECG